MIKSSSFIILLAFLTNTLGPISPVQAQGFKIPTPGVRVHLSPRVDSAMLKGIKVYPDDPLRFDFILNRGDDYQNSNVKTEVTRLIKYFLASLTIPEKDLWVNLSPYEKDRIIPQSFGLTEMGRDLLAEDYMLKQITASLIYPEDEIGKKFWKRIYEEAMKKFGTTNIPVNTFNKVWIVPEKAVVYENAKAGTAYVVEAKLKVMLEQDYLSLEKHTGLVANEAKQSRSDVNALGSQIVREIVIPELTKEVNEGKNFSQLRQVYNSLILAAWYKKKIKDSILEQVYADKKKVAGVQYENSVIERSKLTKRSQTDDIKLIYQRYLQAFKKGVYNYIKEEQDSLTQQVIPRKYFSGGLNMDMAMLTTTSDGGLVPVSAKDIEVSLDILPLGHQLSGDHAMKAAGKQETTGESDLIDEELIKRFYLAYKNESKVPVLLYPINQGRFQVDYFPPEKIFGKDGSGGELAGRLEETDTSNGNKELIWKAGERESWSRKTKEKVEQYCFIPEKSYDWFTFKQSIEATVNTDTYLISVHEREVVVRISSKNTVTFEKYSLGELHNIKGLFEFHVEEYEDEGDHKYGLYFQTFNTRASLKWNEVPDVSDVLGTFKKSKKSNNVFGNVDRMQGLSVLVSVSGQAVDQIRRVIRNILYFNNLDGWKKAKFSQSRDQVESFLKDVFEKVKDAQWVFNQGKHPWKNPMVLETNFAGVWQNSEGRQYVTVVYEGKHHMYLLKKSNELIDFDHLNDSSIVEHQTTRGEKYYVQVIQVNEGDSVIMTSGVPLLPKETIFQNNSPEGIGSQILQGNENSGKLPRGLVVFRILEHNMITYHLLNNSGIDELLNESRKSPLWNDSTGDLSGEDENIKTWIQSGGALPLDKGLLRKLFIYIMGEYILEPGKGIHFRWLNILKEKWHLSNAKQLTNLLKWFRRYSINIQGISDDTFFKFMNAYVDSYNKFPGWRDNFNYILMSDLDSDKKLVLTLENIKRMTRMFPAKMIQRKGVLKAPIKGTNYYIGMEYGLVESTNGIYLVLGEDKKGQVSLQDEVIFKVGFDTEGDTFRIVMLQGAVGKGKEIKESVPSQLGMLPGIALLYAALQMASDGKLKIQNIPEFDPPKQKFSKFLGIRRRYMPTIDNTNSFSTMEINANYSRFGLRKEEGNFGYWQNIEHLMNVTIKGRLGRDDIQARSIPRLMDAVNNFYFVAGQTFNSEYKNANEPLRELAQEGENSKAPKRDRAMRIDEKGGIDLTANKIHLEIKNSSEGIKFFFNSAQLEQLRNAPGFVPVIINIQPLNDLRQFLGIPATTS